MTNESLNVIEPHILVSLINTKLRDFYGSLDLLCEDLDLSKEIIISKLASIDYKYDEVENRFK